MRVQGLWGIVVKCLLCLVIALSFPLQFMPAGQARPSPPARHPPCSSLCFMPAG